MYSFDLKHVHDKHYKLEKGDWVYIPRAIDRGQRDELLNRVMFSDVEMKMLEEFEEKIKLGRAYLTKTIFPINEKIDPVKFQSVNMEDVIARILSVEETEINVEIINVEYFNYLCSKDINKICAGMRYIASVLPYSAIIAKEDNSTETKVIDIIDGHRIICFDLLTDRSPHGKK